MLNCISGMVKKTQSAISILQQRQAEVANVRTAEELVAEVQSKANIAILEVKQAALEELKVAKGEGRSEILDACNEAVNISSSLPSIKFNVYFLVLSELWAPSF